ncbi:MAG TPA: HlyD family efflux transporter periplasmic adaptor subunit [Rhizomicrobium sp.]|nr:HlyD family efflux transporter periplasmic adaptor subunit [Rhizomicrobium sp.]
MAYAESAKMPGGSLSKPFASGNSRALWRRRLLTGLLLGTVAVAAAYGARWYVQSTRIVSTDDAYVDAPLAQITPQVDGTIAQVLVNDTQPVKRGDLLVRLDPADADLAVQQARANYEQAARRVTQYEANVSAALANVAGKEANVKRAQLDLRRRAGISQAGAVSAEEISTATHALETAQSELSVAQQQLAAQRTLTQDNDAARNPEVLAAKAALDKALLDRTRTEIRAPVDGVVAQRHAQIGQRVRVGASLMSVVPLMDAHVDANFKEVQLQNIRPGQKVTLISDLYGSDVVFHGQVAGLGGGTGSAFAVIPAQNATGNWIKVVQRLPVRILLDPQELRRHPLRVGVSMTARVEIDQSADRTRPPILRTAASHTSY